jgi:hypothetical protein
MIIMGNGKLGAVGQLADEESVTRANGHFATGERTCFHLQNYCQQWTLLLLHRCADELRTL